MFSNTRNKVESTIYNESGGNFPVISNIDYIKENKDIKLSNNSAYYLNDDDKYFIRISFNKKVVVSENVIIRVLFNNNTYIERKIDSGEVNYLLIEGDNTIHYEKALKVVDVQILNGYIKDQYNYELNTKIEEEIIKNQSALYVLNNKPEIKAISEKSFYTTNTANIILDIKEEIISSYCISESNSCDDEKFLSFTTNKIKYEFETDHVNNKVCVFVKDKAGNISDCSLVEFNYYDFPKVNFEIEEGNIVNSRAINVNIEVQNNEYFKLEKYCLQIDDSECIFKDITRKIEEKLILSNEEGEQIVKLILLDNSNNKYEFTKKVVLDTIKPELTYDISNKDKVSNYKDILISYKDNYLLSNFNKYEYYLSKSNKMVEGGNWISFENDKSFRIRNVEDGDYYLWVRSVSDAAGNNYSDNDYILISEKLSFDNSKPLIKIVNNNDTINENNLIKEFIITYSDNNEIKETILDSSSIIVNCTNNVKYSINIKDNINNGWIVEIIFEKENLQTGYFALTVLSNLIEDSAGNRNDEISSNLIKIN